MHPELRARLAMLGIGSAADLLQAGGRKCDAKSIGSDGGVVDGAAVAEGVAAAGTCIGSAGGSGSPSQRCDAAPEERLAAAAAAYGLRHTVAPASRSSRRPPLPPSTGGRGSPRGGAAVLVALATVVTLDEDHIHETVGPSAASASSEATAARSDGSGSACGASGGGGECGLGLDLGGSAGGRDDLDSLLLQLDDLDARNRALQRDARAMDSASLVKVHVTPEKASRRPTVVPPSKDIAPAAGPCVLGTGESPAWQHPLSGLSLGGVPGSGAGGDFRRGHRGHREKFALHIPAASDARSSTLPLSPSSARAARRGTKDGLALPPLNPSASAPGKLMSGSWSVPKGR